MDGEEGFNISSSSLFPCSKRAHFENIPILQSTCTYQRVFRLRNSLYLGINAFNRPTGVGLSYILLALLCLPSDSTNELIRTNQATNNTSLMDNINGCLFVLYSFSATLTRYMSLFSNFSEIFVCECQKVQTRQHFYTQTVWDRTFTLHAMELNLKVRQISITQVVNDKRQQISMTSAVDIGTRTVKHFKLNFYTGC